MGTVSYLHNEAKCYFGVYNHKLVIQDSRLIEKKFVVIKTGPYSVVKFTKLHKYIKSGKGKTSVRVDSNTGNRLFYVCKMLNYFFVNNRSEYKLSDIVDITPKYLEEFMYDYSMNHEEDLMYPSESTVNQCVNTLMDFMENYLDEHQHKKSKKHEFYKIVAVRDRNKRVINKKVPNFKVVHSGKVKEIFRDMPNSVFNLVMSYAATHYRSIFFLISLSAFTGMRPSEACNIRQEQSPLGKGIYIYKQGSKVIKVKFDITEEKLLRSDLVSTGGIKNERWQKVYPQFLDAFLQSYELHLDYLSDKKYEKDFCPMSINDNGMAMTYKNYYQVFRDMIDEMKPILLNHSDPEVVLFGHMLLEHNIGPHIFRHWFSVRLTLYGEDVAGLQYWRGDKNPQSAITYLQNKGELSKQLKHTNNVMFDFMSESAKGVIKDAK